MKISTLALPLVCALSLAACGTFGSKSDTTETPAPPAAETQMQQQPAAPETTPMTPEAAQPPVGGSALP